MESKRGWGLIINISYFGDVWTKHAHLHLLPFTISIFIQILFLNQFLILLFSTLKTNTKQHQIKSNECQSIKLKSSLSILLFPIYFYMQLILYIVENLSFYSI